jgi:hypothetical protein
VKKSVSYDPLNSAFGSAKNFVISAKLYSFNAKIAKIFLLPAGRRGAELRREIIFIIYFLISENPCNPWTKSFFVCSPVLHYDLIRLNIQIYFQKYIIISLPDISVSGFRQYSQIAHNTGDRFINLR